EIDYQSLAADFDEYSQPVVRLVDALLNDAVKRSASDIHFEPEQGFLRIRYRIDGVLRQIRSLHKNYWAAMVVRLKVMSNMNIAETRAPQDGRVSLLSSGPPDPQTRAPGPRGHHPRDRPPRQRQDDHALLDPVVHQHRGHQHHDPRG